MGYREKCGTVHQAMRTTVHSRRATPIPDSTLISREMDRRPKTSAGYIFPGVKLHSPFTVKDGAFKYCIAEHERPSSTRPFRVSQNKISQSKGRNPQYNDRGARGNYNAHANGPKWVEPDRTSDFRLSLSSGGSNRVRWHQGWQLRCHGYRRPRSGSWRLEHRERVTRRRRARRCCCDKDWIKHDVLCSAVIPEDYTW